MGTVPKVGEAVRLRLTLFRFFSLHRLGGLGMRLLRNWAIDSLVTDIRHSSSFNELKVSIPYLCHQILGLPHSLAFRRTDRARRMP